MSSPIFESYWVIPGRFKAGEYPGSADDEEARQKLTWLMGQEINLLIDLTEAGEYDLRPYDRLLLDEGSNRSIDVTYRRMPLHDFTEPSREKMVEVLDYIDFALTQGKNIYLHCYGGRGRTGTVVGCFLARHGTAGEQALQLINELRRGIPGHNEQSPETEGQRRMVLQWKAGQ